MLEVRNLECVRGDQTLFSQLDFSLQPGELLHLRGANGSGKTTLMRALCGLLDPTEGEILWNNEPIGKNRDEYYANINYLGHLSGIKGDLTTFENIRQYCDLAGEVVEDAAVDQAIIYLGMAKRAELTTKVLSQGQKKRVGLARLIILKRKLWILDEPFVALDVDAVDTLQKIISEHVGNNGMVVLTTHQDVNIDAGTKRELSLS